MKTVSTLIAVVFLFCTSNAQWEQKNNGLTNTNVKALLISGGYIFAGTQGGGIFRSADGGNNWIPVNSGLTNLNVNALYQKDATIFAGLSGGEGIAYSTNSGDSWNEPSVYVSIVCNAFASIGIAVFAGTDNDLYRSTNVGTGWISWGTQSPGLSGKKVISLVTKNEFTGSGFSDVIYAGTEGNGLFRSTNNGYEFTQYAASTISSTQTITSMVSASFYLFIGVEGQGIYASTNGGGAWDNTGLTNLNVYSMIADGSFIRYAGTSNCKVFRREGSSFGGTWEEISNGLIGSSAVKALVYDGTYLYAGTAGNGVFKALATDAALPLPVELTTLSATVKGNSVLLKWSTSAEVNNYGFEVERSKASNVWEKIGFLSGAGNSNSIRNYEFKDQNLCNGKCTYRLKQVDNDGAYEYSSEVDVLINSPAEFSLAQNFPNPFNPSTKIKYSIPEAGIVTIKIYDLLGREIDVLVDEYKDAGIYEQEYHAGDLANGFYFYNLTSGNYTEVRKMLLIK